MSEALMTEKETLEKEIEELRKKKKTLVEDPKSNYNRYPVLLNIAKGRATKYEVKKWFERGFYDPKRDGSPGALQLLPSNDMFALENNYLKAKGEIPQIDGDIKEKMKKLQKINYALK